MAASKGEPCRGLCRIVEKQGFGDQIKVQTLGVASVLKLTETAAREIGYVSAGRKKCECFLAASAQVLTKEKVQARSRRDRSKTGIVAEFLGQNGMKAESWLVNDLFHSDGDVLQKNGILFIAITKPPKRYWVWKTSLETSRPLEVFYDKETSLGGVECYVLREGKELSSKAGFEFRPYDYHLVRTPGKAEQSACHTDNSYVLKAGESTVIATEDDFPEDERALGAMILKQDQFIGVLYFRDQRLFTMRHLGAVSEEGK